MSHPGRSIAGMRTDEAVLELAADQYGVVAVWQLRALGISSDGWYDLRASPGWSPLSRRVLQRTGTPPSSRRDLMAAVLDASPGAAVAGPAAAHLWGVPGWRPVPIDLVRPKGVSRRPSGLALVHEVVDLHPTQVKVLDGIPVISPSRLVCELCATHPHRAERVLDRLWSDRLLDGRTFRRTVHQLAGRGRRGSPLMRELDEARGPAYVPPASGIERRFTEIVFEPFDRQVDLGGEEWCGRVDFRHRHLPLIVEVQSERFHASLVDRAADARRRAALEAAGFVVVEVWDVDVWHRADAIRSAIGTALRALRAAA